MQVERGEAMKLVCSSCGKEAGEVTAVARLILTAHCPFCGQDFGVAVEPSVAAEVATVAALPAAPPAT
jgi:transcription elongation factor Elf1